MFKLNIREKITGLLVFYFFVALVAIASTLLVSWRLEGGAAAINDAGRERMRSYRIAYLLEQFGQQPTFILRENIMQEVVDFNRTLIELDRGNPSRPLFLPKDEGVNRQIKKLREVWQFTANPGVLSILNETNAINQKRMLINYRLFIEEYVSEINELVTMVEHSNARATRLLRFLQIALVSLALAGTLLLIYLFSQMVVKPVITLKGGD